MGFPGPKAESVIRKNKEIYAKNTAGSRIIPRTGEGAIITTVDGFKDIDLHCDAGVNSLGHRPKKILDAIKHHLFETDGLIFTEHHNAPNPEAIYLAEELLNSSPVPRPAKIFFANSGTEANETARKLCMSFRHRREEKDRTLAIYFKYGFAGRTLGSLPGTSSKPQVQRDIFWSKDDKHDSLYVFYPQAGHDWSETKKEFDRINLQYVDRILMELPCQGEGGIVPVEEKALKYIYDACQKAGVIFISDSVQAGMGRTGTLYGCDKFSWFHPDILVLAKALGGGYPVSAIIFRKRLDFDKRGQHSNTFGGGSLGSVMALAALKELKLLISLGAVEKIEKILDERLRGILKSKHVKDIRGMGAMWGVEFYSEKIRDLVIKKGEAFARTEEYGLRLLSAGHEGNYAIRIMPPFVIEEELLHKAMDLFEKALRALG